MASNNVASEARTAYDLDDTDVDILGVLFDAHPDALIADDVADDIDRARRSARDRLNALSEDALVVRSKPGRSYAYELSAEGFSCLDGDGDGDTVTADGDTDEEADVDAVTAPSAAPDEGDPDFEWVTTPAGVDDEFPVNRDYDFDARVPHGVDEYIPQNGELDEIRGLIDTRELTGLKPRFGLSGPTQCGKSLLAEYLAQEYDAPLFEIQGGAGLREADMLGQMGVGDDGTTWTDGPLPQALISSQERLTFLLLDELNRTPSNRKSALFPVLDDRCRVVLPGRSGEIVRGNPQNLVVISTLNIGTAYTATERIDLAEKARVGGRWDVDYLGVEQPEREAQLLIDRAGVGPNIADRLVDAANTIRTKAEDKQNKMTVGLPTGALINWSRAAIGLSEAGIDNPVVAAGKNQIIRPFFADSERANNVVSTVIHDHFDGAEIERATPGDLRGGAGN